VSSKLNRINGYYYSDFIKEVKDTLELVFIEYIEPHIVFKPVSAQLKQILLSELNELTKSLNKFVFSHMGHKFYCELDEEERNGPTFIFILDDDKSSMVLHMKCCMYFRANYI